MTQQINGINEKIIQSRNEMDKNIKTLKAKIENFEKSIKENWDEDEEEDKKKEKDETDLRIQKNLFNAMIKKYQKVINRYQNIETNIKSEKKYKLIREAETVIHRDLNEEEKQNLIENPNKLQDMYKDQITGQIPKILQNAVRDLEERHKDIVKLENSIIELHKMVTELNSLVQYQGEMVDNIAENVNKQKNILIKEKKKLLKVKKIWKVLER